MIQRWALVITVAVVATSALTAQGSPVQYQALKNLLGLTDAEISTLKAEGTRSSVTLSDAQKAQLEVVAEVLEHAWVYQAVTLGLIDADRWPGGYLCYDEPSYLGLRLTSKQFDELQRLRDAPKAARLAVLTEDQRERLASYESDLELANQPIDLGLISRQPFAEPLCH